MTERVIDADGHVLEPTNAWGGLSELAAIHVSTDKFGLDEQVHGFGGFCPEMKLEPSEYFARQCWISFEIDEPTLPALIPFIGEERVVWGSDYPHHDATFPGAVDELREVIAPLPPSV